jgi:hypothetical protein
VRQHVFSCGGGVQSTACLVLAEHDMGAQMRRILAASGQTPPQGKPALELNVAHPLVARLDATESGEGFDELALLLFDQARLAESGGMERTEIVSPSGETRSFHSARRQNSAPRARRRAASRRATVASNRSSSTTGRSPGAIVSSPRPSSSSAVS